MEGIKIKEHNEEELKKLKPGDLIRFYNECDEHWAVYYGEGEKDIFLWMGNGVDSRPGIKRESFWTFAKNMVAEKENNNCIEGTKVVERTKDFMQKLEQEEKKQEGKKEELKAYPVLFNSSEHFAKWCHYGLGGLDSKWGQLAPGLVIDISQVKNVVDFVEGIFTNHISDGKAIRHNVDVLKQLQPGDVVSFSRVSYKHWATYIGQIRDKKSVIHWWDNDSATDPYIQIVPFWDLAQNCTAEKISADLPDNFTVVESEAVKKAEAILDSELAHKGQELIVKADMFHCSEDFAKWFYLTLMGKAGSTLFVEVFEQFIWKCCGHDSYQLGKGRDLLNEGVLLTLEHDKFSQLFVGTVFPIHDVPGFGMCFGLDPCSLFTRRKCLEVLKNLTPGDLIKYVKYSRKHWGVYIGHDEKHDPYAIHWTVDYHCAEPDRLRSCIWNEVLYFPYIEKLEKVNDNKLEDTIINGAEVVERVKAFVTKIGAEEKNGKDFSDLFNDCEHFAKWCRYGLGPKSLKISKEQIEKIKDIWNFVRGEFSVIPWQINSHGDISVSQMKQFKKGETDISSSLQKVKLT